MKYSVSGMSCAVCQQTVEKIVKNTDGVTSVNVSLLTNSMDVEGAYDEQSMLKQIKSAGYKAKRINDNQLVDQSDIQNKSTTKNLLIRFLASAVLLIPLMILSMGHMVMHINLNYKIISTIQLILTVLIIIINIKYFLKGIYAVFKLHATMDTLVSIGAGASFCYSLVMYVLMFSNNENNLHNLYFESAATILTLITFGKLLESFSKGKTNNAIKSLMEIKPTEAIVVYYENGAKSQKVIDAKQLKMGDIFVIKPGGKVPADGVIIDGITSIDESMITGESIPVDKAEGDQVFEGTINTDGFVECKCTKVGDDTTLSKIIKLVTDASASKAPIARIADKVASVFVPSVMIIALVTFVVWMIIGESVGFSLTRAISVLVISCPCALGLATPVAIMVGSGVAAKKGILFKNAIALENTGKVEKVFLDKTGTITNGKPSVSEFKSYTRDVDCLTIISSLEFKSQHPLAKAIVDYAVSNEKTQVEVNDFVNLTGSGIKGTVDGKTYYIGSVEFVQDICKHFEIDESIAHNLEAGRTIVLMCDSEKVLCMFAIEDDLKKDADKTIYELKKLNVEPIMLTGDHDKTALAIASKCGIDTVHASLKPENKEQIVKKYTDDYKTLMVGDGINDAPSLARADVGMAVGNGTDVAIETADVVILNDNINSVAKAIKLSKRVLKNIYENLFWAFIYNVICIPVAAGVFYSLGVKLTPMWGSLAMGLSSVCVVLNALRLNLLNKKDNL